MSTPGNGRTALREIAKDPVSRRRFLAFGGASGGAAALLAACGGGDDSSAGAGTTTVVADEALAQFGKGDLGIVNYALTLEYLEAAFYADVVRSGLFKGADLDLIKSIGLN